MLYDRVATEEGRPQRYGTVFTCQERKLVLAPFGLLRQHQRRVLQALRADCGPQHNAIRACTAYQRVQKNDRLKKKRAAQVLPRWQRDLPVDPPG